MDIERIAKEVERIARQTGKMMLNQEELLIYEKTDATNIVTNMDVKCQKYIIEECCKLIPNSNFLAEEEGQQKLGEEYTWVIDPIDGTTNYAYDYKKSCVSIALLYQKKGLIGVVYDPYLDECFVGIEGKQSTCNGKKINASSNDIDRALVIFGSVPYNKLLADQTFDIVKKVFLRCRDVRRSGCAALDMCSIASGRADAYFELELSPWDFAAGIVICGNAGAKVMALNGEFDYESQVGVLFANSNCFEEMKKMVGIYE